MELYNLPHFGIWVSIILNVSEMLFLGVGELKAFSW
jgi:hypothetical protein